MDFTIVIAIVVGLAVQWVLIRSAIVSALRQDRENQNPTPKIPGTVFN